MKVDRSFSETIDVTLCLQYVSSMRVILFSFILRVVNCEMIVSIKE